MMLGISPLFCSVFAAAAMVLLVERYYREYSGECNRPRLIGAALFSLFFGQAFSLGRLIVFSGFPRDMRHNYLTIDFAGIFTGVLVAIVIFPAIICALGFFNSRDFLSTLRRKSSSRIFYLSWATIVGFWLPYLLTYCPGGIVGDGALTLEDALRDGPPHTNHWSVAYIMVLKLFLYLGSLFSDRLQTGIYLWVILATVAVAAAFAAVAATLWRRGAPRWFVVATVAMYALCGFFASYGMSLWKDGTFGAGVVLLSLMLWDYSDADRKIGKIDVVLFAMLGLFLCVWRSNGPFLLATTLAGMAILLRRRVRALLVSGVLVVVFSTILTGPLYRAWGIGSDSVRESISIPAQQLAAVINHNRPMTEAQKEILFDILPEESWRKYYFPGISDFLKVRMDTNRISSQLPGMLKVWAQLLPSNFQLYVETYLLQTIGFWKPFCWQGLFLDYWVGIQDLKMRGYMPNDLFSRHVGYGVKPILDQNMRFISSGTMVWILLLACTAILTRRTGRTRRLLPLLPLVAGWALIMISTPQAYFYRYIVFLPMALPVIAVLPFGLDKEEQPKHFPSGHSFRRSALFAFMLVASFAALAIAIAQKSQKVETLGDEPFDIWFYGDDFNADHYALCGYWPEQDCSWTFGKYMNLEIPVKSSSRDFDVKISSLAPFNGEKHWIARQNGEIVGQGALNARGDMKFVATAADGKLRFSVEFPDAERPCDVDKAYQDHRLISMRIQRIRIGPHIAR